MTGCCRPGFSTLGCIEAVFLPEIRGARDDRLGIAITEGSVDRQPLAPLIGRKAVVDDLARSGRPLLARPQIGEQRRSGDALKDRVSVDRMAVGEWQRVAKAQTSSFVSVGSTSSGSTITLGMTAPALLWKAPSTWRPQVAAPVSARRSRGSPVSSVDRSEAPKALQISD